MKKNKVRNLVNSAKLTVVLVIVNVLPGCEYNYHYNCPDCGKGGTEDTRKPLIEGDNNIIYMEKTEIDNSGSMNYEKQNAVNAGGCSGASNTYKGTQNIGNVGRARKKTVIEDKKEEKAKEEKVEEEKQNCKTVTTTTYEHFCISGDANDVINAAIGIVNSNHR